VARGGRRGARPDRTRGEVDPVPPAPPVPSSAPDTTWRRVLARRYRRHFLTGPPAGTPHEVADRLLGVQAQVPSCAEQVVAVRGPTPAALRAGLADGSLLRTWAARGTLHLLSVDGAPAQLALLAAPRTWEKGSWQRQFATAAEIGRLAELVATILPGRSLTREELVAELDREVTPEPAERLGSGWGTLLKPLAWQGLIVNGEPRGSRPTFTDPATWTGRPVVLPDPDAAARVLVPAYLDVHGPASATAFDAWLLRGGTRRPTLRRWFAELVEDGVIAPVTMRDERPNGERAEADPEQRYARVADLDELADPPDPDFDERVRLLPAFDQWVLGPGTTEAAVLAPRHRARVSRAAGWDRPGRRPPWPGGRDLGERGHRPGLVRRRAAPLGRGPDRGARAPEALRHGSAVTLPARPRGCPWIDFG
jgi:Winged helix DNA-binding domain